MWVQKTSCEKDYIWNPAKCSCKNSKYLVSIIENLVIMCQELDAVETKTVTKNFNEKHGICKIESFYILLVFLSISIALLIAGGIYCYLTKYWAKQKHLCLYYVTNKKLKRFCINNKLWKMESNDELKEIDEFMLQIVRVITWIT